MAAVNKRSLLWPDRIDILVFWGGIVVFMFGGLLVLGTLSDALGLAMVPVDQTMFRYGGTAVLIWLPLIGTFSFVIGGLVVRCLRRVRARWLSGLVGGAYSFVFITFSLFFPMRQGSMAGLALVAFMFLFPAIGLIVGSLRLQRSVSSSQAEQ